MDMCLKGLMSIVAFTCVLLVSLSPAYGFEFPALARGEIGRFLIDAKRAEILIPSANYAAGNQGMCYGIDRLNFTLLSKVTIAESAQVDSDDQIFAKLVRAYESSPNVTIYSASSSSREFMRRMHQRWGDFGNPIKRAIEHISASSGNIGLSSKSDLLFQALSGTSLTPPPEYFVNRIREETPVGIGIIGNRGRHALTVYGFKETGAGDQIILYVLDPNSPGKFRELRFDTSRSRWYYEPWNSHVDVVTESDPYGQDSAAKEKFALVSIHGSASCGSALQRDLGP